MPEPTGSVEPNSVLQRIRMAQSTRVTANALATRWFDQTIKMRLGGVARLIASGELENHFRRAFGGALGAGASPEANKHQPCPWEPPCALDVFFREQLRDGGDGLPKPFVPLMDVNGPDLIAGIRIFGLATDWMPAIELAFVDALNHRLPWRKLGLAHTPPLLDRWVETREGLQISPVPKHASVQWITPLDAEAIDPSDKAGSILTRLHRRLCGFANWHDCALSELAPSAVANWESSVDTSEIEAPQPITARSGLQRRTFRSAAAGGTLRLTGNIEEFWPILLMGERCAVGRGAVRGLGRYRLSPGL